MAKKLSVLNRCTASVSGTGASASSVLCSSVLTFSLQKFERKYIKHKVEDRFTSQNGWTAEGWNSIHRKFNQMFPFARYTKAHLQEKNKDLKATYKAIRDARKDSGAGLDPASGMVIGGPNVWDKIEKYHKKVVKFRKKGFLHYNSCELLYEGSIATGDLSFTSTDPVHQSFENIEEEHMETVRVGQEASVGAMAARLINLTELNSLQGRRNKNQE
ncbi:hypothetical protein EJB05_27633, partial [Eragrostis curvula]